MNYKYSIARSKFLVLYKVHYKSLSHNKKNSLKIIEETEKIKLSHIRNGNYDKKYINLAWMELWKEYANYFFANGERIKYSEYFHKYITLSKKYKLELKLKIWIKYFFIIDIHIIFLNFLKLINMEKRMPSISVVIPLYN